MNAPIIETETKDAYIIEWYSDGTTTVTFADAWPLQTDVLDAVAYAAFGVSLSECESYRGQYAVLVQMLDAITDAMTDVQAMDIFTHIARMYDVDIILGDEED